MLLYYPFWMFMGFIYTFISFLGLTYLPEAQPVLLLFCLFQYFEEKEYQMEYKRNETFGSVIFGTNMIQRTWSGRQEIKDEAMRQGGAPTPWAHPPPSWAPRGSTNLLLPPIYIPTYPKTIEGHHETLFPLPQPSIPVRSHLGAFSGAPPEGALITEGFYINTIASPMMCE